MTDNKDIQELLNRHYPLRFNKVAFLREGGCVSYAVESGYGKYLLKIVKPAFLDTFRQSADIIGYLATQGFPVPRIVPTVADELYDLSNGRASVLFEFIEGREPEAGEMIEDIGELVGRLHNTMEGYGGSLTIRGRPFFINRYIRQLREKRYPDNKLAWFTEYGNELWNRVQNLPRGYCHGDLHRGNLMLTASKQLYLLDFDTSCMAFPTYDIAVMCDETDYFRLDPAGFDAATSTYRRFLEGYRKCRNPTAAEITAFYDFIAIRHYQLQATIIEINGLDCVDEAFVDRQLDWLKRWREISTKRRA